MWKFWKKKKQKKTERLYTEAELNYAFMVGGYTGATGNHNADYEFKKVVETLNKSETTEVEILPKTKAILDDYNESQREWRMYLDRETEKFFEEFKKRNNT